MQRSRPAEARQLDVERLSLAAALMLGLVFGVGQAIGAVSAPIDFDHYWRASLDALYPPVWDDFTLFPYPPPMAQVLAPFQFIPPDLARVPWTIFCFACLWYCVRAWTLPVVGLGMLAIVLPRPLAELVQGPLSAVLLGNVNIVVAAAIVAAFRRPEAWAVAGLLKVGTGVGILWYPFRREWTRFGRAVAATLVIAGASFAIAPHLWFDWVAFVLANPGGSPSVPVIGPPLWSRILAAVILTWYAARTNRPWLVAIACAVANPALYGFSTLVAVGCGALALRQPVHPDRARGDG